MADASTNASAKRLGLVVFNAFAKRVETMSDLLRCSLSIPASKSGRVPAMYLRCKLDASVRWILKKILIEQSMTLAL